MSRPLRLEFPGACYHITARGNRQEAIFLDDGDRMVFLDLLGKEVLQQNWALYAFCLMSNHYHLLMETPEPNLVKGMRRLNGVYTQYFNRRHHNVGHVLQGRYKSILVEKQNYLLELTRYVVLNPVRAGMVEHAGQWHWSSYLPTTGRIACPPWLAAHRVLELFDSSGAPAQLYERFVEEGVNRESPWRSLSGQIYLGSQAFRTRVQKGLQVKNTKNVASAQWSAIRVSPEDVLRTVAQVHGISMALVKQRESKVAFRHAVYLLRRRANLSLREVAEMMGVSIGRVTQIQSETEKAVADPALSDIVIRLSGE